MNSRKQKYADETKAALIAASRKLFSENGYAQTSLDAIAQAEGLTKGAVYHHFRNKEEIFEAVITAVMGEALQDIEREVSSIADYTEKVARAIDLFIDLCLTSEYQRLVLQDGPAVLGWEKWKTLEKQYTFTFVERLVREMPNAGEPSALSVEILTRLVIACVIEIAFMVMESSASADSKDEIRDKSKVLLLRIMQSFSADMM